MTSGNNRMSGERQELQKDITDTFNHIHKVREFWSNIPQWKKTRETEIKHMKDIKQKYDRLGMIKKDRKHAELQKELDEVLKETMEGLKELHIFLNAVEELAVTSLCVFMENQPENINPHDVQAVIITAQEIRPLLLVFKRNPEVFFRPKFQNVEVMVYMLGKYLETTEKISDMLDQSNIDLNMAAETSVEFNKVLCENDKQKMVDHIKKLDEIRPELKKYRQEQKYITDTIYFISTVREFCSNFPQWKKTREKSIDRMNDFKKRDDEVGMINADSKHAELQKELDEVLKETMEGLKELHIFLDAVEKLAVTSLYVFMENQVLRLPENINACEVQAVIITAQQICPLLLVFKRDSEVFFLPKFQNVEVLVYMLGKYLETTEKICDMLDQSFFSDMDLKVAAETSVSEFNEALCEKDKQKMADHIKKLHEIRMDEDFRMVFLFQEVSCSGFINEFEARKPKMLKFLDEVEECAVQLDRMCKGAKISSVAGSSVGAVGGVLSIVGLALIPVTFGASFGLTMAGIGLGVTSGVNSLVTTATELGVNHTNQKRVNEVFQNFMEDIQVIQDCLEEVTNQPAANVEQSMTSMAVGVGRLAANAGAVGRSVDVMVDTASAFKALQTERVVVSASSVAAQEGKAVCNLPRLASDVPDIGQAAVKAPLALSTGARAGFIVANSLFLGMDIFFIVKDSISLAKSSKTKVSKFIRARAALWLSEINSWEKICRSLSEGLTTAADKKEVLQMPFYLDPAMENLEGV